jgi:invasion protein IalB
MMTHARTCKHGAESLYERERGWRVRCSEQRQRRGARGAAQQAQRARQQRCICIRIRSGRGSERVPARQLLPAAPPTRAMRAVRLFRGVGRGGVRSS